MRRALPIAALLALVIPAASRAQVIQQSGHALDANLRLGSGGYNSAGAGIGRSHYERQVYQVSRGSVDHFNAFMRERVYTPTRSTAAVERAGRMEDYRAWSRSSGGGGGAAAAPRPRRAPPTWDPGYAPEPLPALPPPAEAPAPGLPAERAAAQMDVLSYALGFQLGREIRQGLDRDGVELDPEPIVEGFRDGTAGREPRVGRDALAQILAAVRERVDGRMVERLRDQDPAFRTLLEKNLAESRSFQEAFGKRAGVVTLPNGIQHQILATGTGPSPGPGDRVIVRYRILDVEGRQVTEATREVVVRDMVPGAAQVVQMMRVGDRWLVSIPPELAFGTRGHPPEIEPNTTIFGELELLEIRAVNR